MIRHCSLWKFKEDTSGEVIEQIADRFYEAVEKIPAAIRGQFGRNIGYLAENYDFALTIDFEDLDGYRAYVAHELHGELYRKYLQPNIASRVAVQFELR